MVIMALLSSLSRLLALLSFLNAHVQVYSQSMTSDLPEITTHPQGGVYDSDTPIVLTCGATNLASIQWTHNDAVLSPDDSRISSSTTLTVSSLTAETSGTYVCLATNDVGTVASIEAVLTLAELTPSSFFSMGPTNPIMVSTTMGQPVTLSCGAHTSIPDSDIDWEVYIAGGSNLVIDASFDMAIIGINGSLYFQNPTIINAQTYICKVTNPLFRNFIFGFIQLTVNDSTSTVPTHVIVAPRDTTVNEGDAATFECIVGGSSVPTIRWTCPDCTNRLRVRMTQGGARLRVISVQSTDVGSYTCTAGGVNYTASLTIRDPPTITSPLPATTTTIIYGNPIHLDCAASGGDGIKWQWYQNGTRLGEFTGSTLDIATSEEQHSGTYQCYASNSAGFDSSVTLISVITVPASISSSLPPSQLAFSEESFEVSCNATGAPPPSFEWFLGELPLQHGNEFDISEPSVLPSVLRITSVNVANTGNYTCRTTNNIGEREIGRDQTSIVLTVIEPTVITQQHGMIFTAQADRPTILICEVTHDERAMLEFSWTKDGAPLLMDDRVMFVDETVSGNVLIDGVLRSDAGIYVCTVTTTYDGLSGPTISTRTTNFTVTTTPVAPQILGLTSPSPTSLEVVWGFTGTNDFILLFSVEIQLASNPNSEWKQQTHNVNAITIKIIDGLLPATRYNVRIVALYEDEVRVESGVMSIQTQDGVPSGPPLEVKIKAISNYQLQVTWQPPSVPNGVIINYSIQYRLKDETMFTTVIVNGTLQIHVINDLVPRERYTVQMAASTSGGMGPYSDMQEAITVEQGSLVEPGGGQPHEQIWFIVVMVVIAVILISVIAVFVLVVIYTKYKKDSRTYEVQQQQKRQRHPTRDLSEDAAQDYPVGRSKRSDREGSSVFAIDTIDGFLEKDSAVSVPTYTATPQLSTGSGARLMGHHAPDYINPPSFEEAIKSRSRTHSAASHYKDRAPLWDTDDEGTKPVFMGDDRVLRNRGIFTNGNTEFDYDSHSDSVEKPAYSESMTTEGTEYSHLQGAGGNVHYNHLNVNPPPETIDLATLV